MFLSKHKNGIYYVYYSDIETGKRKAISTKQKMKNNAFKFLSEFNNNLKKVLQDKENKLTVYYLEDLRNEVMKYVNDNFSKGTAEIYAGMFKNFLRIAGNNPLRLITSKDIEGFKSVRLNEVKPETVNIDIRTLKASFNIAIRYNWIENNPVNNVSQVKTSEKEILSFTNEQIKLILNNIKTKQLKDFVLFAYLTGCRLQEICNVQWNDINFKDRVLTIRNKATFKTKTGKNRIIPISENLFQLLQSILNEKENGNVLNYFNPESYVFPNRQNYKYTTGHLSDKFKEVLRTLDFPEYYHFHCLRHTFITNLIKSGVNINYVKEIAGHSNIETTMKYVHLITEDLRDAMNKINFN